MSHSQWILYVSKCKENKTQFCRGSHVCIRFIDTFDLEQEIAVQDADILRSGIASLPEWLVGTPTIVSRSTYEVYKGTDAIERIVGIAMEKRQKDAASRSLHRSMPSNDAVSARQTTHGVDTEEGVDEDRGWPSQEREQRKQRQRNLEDVLLQDDAGDTIGDDSSHGDHNGGGGLDFGSLVDPEVVSSAEDKKVTEADVKRFMSQRGM